MGPPIQAPDAERPPPLEQNPPGGRQHTSSDPEGALVTSMVRSEWITTTHQLPQRSTPVEPPRTSPLRIPLLMLVLALLAFFVR